MNNKITKLFRLRSSFVVVFIMLQSLVILLSFTFFEIEEETLDIVVQKQVDDTVVFVNSVIEMDELLSKTAVLMLINNGTMVHAVSTNDRQELGDYIEPIWQNLKEVGFEQLSFFKKAEGADGISYFYRAHSPDLYDDSADHRPMVLSADRKKQLIVGVEQGRNGYGFKAVAPLFKGNVEIGLIEAGFDVGESYLKELEHAYPGNWAIYNLERGVSSLNDRLLIASHGDAKDTLFKNFLPDPKILSKIKQGEHHFVLDEAAHTNTIYIPIKNFRGDIAAFVQYVGHTEHFTRQAHSRESALEIGIAGLLLSSLILYFLYRTVTSPIRQLVVETQKIKEFNLDDPIQISSPLREIGDLVDSMAAMKTGLQSFRKYIPDQLVRQLIESKQEAVVSGQRRHLTVFFSDIADFSTISEKLTPNELAEQLSEYLSEMTAIIVSHDGTVDKYIGDSIMAFWGAPVDIENSDEKACLAALECQTRLKELESKWIAEGKPALKTRIGIHTGDMIVGNIGSTQRLSYTVMGDAVNLASRLEGLNKEYGTNTIISQSTLVNLPDEFSYRLLDIVVVKGKTEPVPIYELVATKGNITSVDADFLEMFSKAVGSYIEKDWARAILRFERLLKSQPDDYACKLFIERAKEFERHPPAADWAGEYVHTRK